jgi:cytochrome c2
LVLLLVSPFAAHAQSAAHFSPFFRFTEQSGEQLFANVCQGCHMPNAKGATGAGTYPSLAANKISRPAAIRSMWWSTANARCRPSAP